jgi:nitroreductase
MSTPLLETMRTLNSVRAFRSDPVPRATVRSIIEAATWAASARNAQPWFFVAIDDPVLRTTIAGFYLQAWRAAQGYTASTAADHDIEDRPGYARMMRAVDELATHLADVPVLVLVGLDSAQLGPIADAAGNLLAPLSAYASIFPAVQNLMLAARGHGLGTTLTTLHTFFEHEIRTLLAIPPTVHLAALLPMGYPQRAFRAVKRKPVDEVAFLNRWGTSLK